MKKPVLILAVAALGGCYASTPIVSETRLAPDSRVLAQLTDQGTVDLARMLGPSIAGVEGRLVSLGSDTVTLRLNRTFSRQGVTALWGGETVHIARVQIALLSERQIDRRRTIVAVAGVTVAAVALVSGLKFLGIGTVDRDPPTPPGGEGLRAP